MSRKFELGDVLVHSNVLPLIRNKALTHMLERHKNCDWGVISPGEKANNNDAFKNNGRIVSCYFYYGELCMIMTEGDRRLTLVVLLADYNRVHESFLELKRSQKQD